MSIEQVDKVDVVSVSEDGTYELTINDHWDWVSEFDHVELLEEKLNNYLSFIEGGELVEHYPEAKGKPVRIDIAMSFEPGELGKQFLDAARKTIEEAGIGFSYAVKTEAAPN